jgi:hypothetical protein
VLVPGHGPVENAIVKIMQSAEKQIKRDLGEQNNRHTKCTNI